MFNFSKLPSAQSNPNARVVDCEMAYSESLHELRDKLLISQLRASLILCVSAITFV